MRSAGVRADERDGVGAAADQDGGTRQERLVAEAWPEFLAFGVVLHRSTIPERGQRSATVFAAGRARLGRDPSFGYTYRTRRVYDRCMTRVRTNIEIENSYLEMIMDRYGVRTKTEAVDLALRHLAGQPMTREEALAMRGAKMIGDVPSDASPTGSA
jgi:Arc/MetJ family transcription regulator